MATFKLTGWTDRSASTGGQISTQANSLANGAFSAVTSAFDNTSNLDQWGAFVVDLASLNPTTGAYVQLFMVSSFDNTNFEDAPSSTNPGSHNLIATVTLATGAATKRELCIPFRLHGGYMKWVVKNGSGVAFAASGNTMKLWTFNETVV